MEKEVEFEGEKYLVELNPIDKKEGYYFNCGVVCGNPVEKFYRKENEHISAECYLMRILKKL